MYVNITGSANNKDVYIYQSYRKENGKTSSRIYRKLGKLSLIHIFFHRLRQFALLNQAANLPVAPVAVMMRVSAMRMLRMPFLFYPQSLRRAGIRAQPR